MSPSEQRGAGRPQLQLGGLSQLAGGQRQGEGDVQRHQDVPVRQGVRCPVQADRGPQVRRAWSLYSHPPGQHLFPNCNKNCKPAHRLVKLLPLPLMKPKFAAPPLNYEL